MASRDAAFACYDISDNMRVAINSCGETEWARFFESVKVQKLKQIENCDPKDLTKIQNQVQGLTEIENIFKGLKVPVHISSQIQR